jgi:DNA-binding protein H-NS
MAKNSSLASMSVQSLLKMRDDIADVLSRKADDLKAQLSALAGGKKKVGRPPGKKLRKKMAKVAPQFRSKKDPKVVWSGRGGTPRWMKDEMKGTKLRKESFRIKAGT